MKFCLSILLLVLLIGFNTHGQIGPWVQIPTPGTERIANIKQNQNNLFIQTADQFGKLNFKNNITTFLSHETCNENITPVHIFESQGSLYSLSFLGNDNTIYLSTFDEDGLCNQYNYLTDQLNFRNLGIFTGNIPVINNFLVIPVAYFRPGLMLDSLTIYQVNLSNNQFQVVSLNSYGIFSQNEIFGIGLEDFFLRKRGANNNFLLSYNPFTLRLDTVANDASNIVNAYRSKNLIFGRNFNNKLLKVNSLREWEEFTNGINPTATNSRVFTLDDTTFLITNEGFYFLGSNDTWVRKPWPELFSTAEIVKAGGKVYALANGQLFILFNNEWQPVPMTGVIRGSSGSLYANDQYMFFSDRYLSFNNGQSWFDQQRYFNSTPQNSIGSIQTMRPEAWFSFNSANNWSVHRTTDQGTTWQTVDTRFLGNPVSMGSTVARNVRWGNTDTLYAAYGTNFLRLAVSTDAGLTWRDDANLNLQLPAAAANNIGYACTLQVVNNNMLLYTSSGKLFRTGSRSTPFEEVYDFGPQDLSRVFITGSNDTVIVNMNPNNSPAPRKTLISTDGGRRFQEIRVPFPNQFASFALRRGQLWCANNGELSISNDLGRSFQRLYNPTDNFPFPNAAGGVATFNITDSMLFINGNHVAFYTRLPQGRVVSLAAEIQAPKEQLSLFPNPANESVFINGLIKQENIRVFDLKGQEVLQGTISPDESLNIEQLPSGLYMVVVGQQRLKVLKR